MTRKGPVIRKMNRALSPGQLLRSVLPQPVRTSTLAELAAEVRIGFKAPSRIGTS